jgi:hypothetical protein
MVGSVVLAGCAGGTGDLDAPDSPVARYTWDGGAAMDALLEGTLEVRDGCLVVNLAYDPYLPTVAVFPRKYTSWDAATQTLTYAGIDYAMGDAIWAGGGGAAEIPEEGFPAACEPFVTEDNGFFLIQDDSLEPYSER